MNIERLPKEFEGTGEVKGFKFTLQERTNSGLIYKVEDQGVESFEVFKIRTSEKIESWETKKGTGVFKEVYPKSKDFGVWAWTFYEMSSALDKLKTF